jgi:hypothetical protein
MTKLLEQAIAKLKTRPIREQDSRSILNENLSYGQNRDLGLI